MTKEPRMTASKLGALCGANPCYACFWCLSQLNYKVPFNFGTPYIMQLLDQRQKQLARVTLSEEGELPAFFGPFQSATKMINVVSLSAYHRETGLYLYGLPDLVFENKDGSRMIVDNKTAFPKKEDEDLFYKYQMQVNFYGLLCELAPEAYKVSRVGILYYVYAPASDDEVLDTTGPTSITVQFTPRLTLVDYDPKRIVLPLLKKVRELFDMDEAPESADECPDCPLIQAFAKLFDEKDDLTYLRKALSPRDFQNYQARQSYLALVDSKPNIQQKAESMIRRATPGGVLANWDFTSDPGEDE